MDSLDGRPTQRLVGDMSRRPTDISFRRENSRAPARKGHEPQAFLSIGEPGEETAIVKDVGVKPATAADGFMGRSLAATAARARPAPAAAAAIAAAAHVAREAPAAAAAAASHSASTQRSSSRFNESFASFERPAARSGSRRRAEQRPLATPETTGVYVTAPFKQDVTRGPSVAKKAVSPGAGLKEATLIATMEVSRAIKEELHKSRTLLTAASGGGQAAATREPRLLKAPMQPLVAVRREGPSIEQCRGVQAGRQSKNATSAYLYSESLDNGGPSLGPYGLGTAAPQTPCATPQSVLLDADRDMLSESDIRVRSSGPSRPATEGGRQRSAAAATPGRQVQRSALRRSSAQRSADADVNVSPAPRNSVDEETNESHQQQLLQDGGGRVPRQQASSAAGTLIHRVPSSAHTGYDSKSVRSPVDPADARSADADDQKADQRPPSSRSDGSRKQVSRGHTFLTEHASSERDASTNQKSLESSSGVGAKSPETPAAATASFGLPAGSSRAASAESTDRLQRGSERSSSAKKIDKNGSADNESAPQLDVTVDDSLVHVGAAADDIINSAAVAGADAEHRLDTPIARTTHAGRSENKTANSDDLEFVSHLVMAPTTESSSRSASGGTLPVKEASAIASRKTDDKYVRCKDSADDGQIRRRNSDDDEDDRDGVDDKRRQGAPGSLEGSTSVTRGFVPTAAAASSDGQSGSQGSGQTTEAAIADRSPLTDADRLPLTDNGYQSLQAQLSSIIAELRCQHPVASFLEHLSPLNALDHVGTGVLVLDSKEKLRHDLGIASMQLTEIFVGRASYAREHRATESKVEEDNDSLSICLSPAVEDQAIDHGDVVLLNRDHKQTDIYRDLFYHGWGVADLTLACLSSQLTRQSASRELCQRRRRKSSKRQHAWEDGAGLPSAEVLTRLGAPAAAGNDGERAASMPAARPEERTLSKLCIRPWPSTLGAEERWTHMAADHAPPPLCFEINARPPAGHFFYFSYGMHMNADRLGASLGRAVDDFRLWGLLFGFQLMFNKKGVDVQAGLFPNIEYNPLSSVEGCVYRLAEAELSLVDAYHGYPLHYARAVLPVWVVNCRDPDNYGVAQHCVPAVAYVAQDGWLHNAASKADGERLRDYSVRQCLKSADLLTSNYRQQLLAMRCR